MKKFDRISTDRMAREIRRINALKLLLEGNSLNTVVKKVGCHRSAIYQWLKQYREEGGIKGLNCRKITGAPSKLSDTQKKIIFDIVTMERPEQNNLQIGLWNLAMIRQLILDQFGITLSAVSVGRLLNEFGLSLRKLQKKDRLLLEDYYNQWMSTEYNVIKKEANKDDAKIYFCNVFGIHSKYCTKTTNAKEVLNPNILTKESCSKVNMLFLASTQGQIWFRNINGRIKASSIFKILENLIKHETNRIFIVVDYNSVFMRKTFQIYAKSQKEKLKIIEMDLFPFLDS